MPPLSKLQIRAKVLSVISEIKSLNEYNKDIFTRLFSELNAIEDKKALFDIFIKEFIKLNEKEYIFAGSIIKDIISADKIEDKVFELIKSSNYSDDAKYKLVQLLRLSGSVLDYNTVPQYFDNPQEVIDSDTKKLLENAVFNPEAMLDFLDFVSAVKDTDKNVLLQSLKLDYSGDMLANIIYPILYSDFDDNFKLNVIEILGESKSSLAIAPFNYLIQTSDNENIVNSCKTGLKKLKLSGASEEKAQEYFQQIIKDTQPAEFFTTIPDGQGNQAFIISRVNNSIGKFTLSAVVTNDKSGIIDCFGFFNISQNELAKVLSKFYQSEGKYRVMPDYVKTCIDEAFELTIKNKRHFPYEFICWNTLLKDLPQLNESIEEQITKSRVNENITKDDILNILTKDYSFRWYIKPSENEQLNKAVDKIYNAESITIDEINTLTKSIEIEDVWKKRVYHCIYLLAKNSQKDEANIFYAMISNDEFYNIFKQILVQRSIFNHFVSLKENAKQPLLTPNIFRKKQQDKEKPDVKKIDMILELLKKKWINE